MVATTSRERNTDNMEVNGVWESMQFWIFNIQWNASWYRKQQHSKTLDSYIFPNPAQREQIEKYMIWVFDNRYKSIEMESQLKRYEDIPVLINGCDWRPSFQLKCKVN